jgi:hypothetical protein
VAIHATVKGVHDFNITNPQTIVVRILELQIVVQNVQKLGNEDHMRNALAGLQCLKFFELGDRPLGVLAHLGQFRQGDIIAVLRNDFGGGHIGYDVGGIL